MSAPLAVTSLGEVAAVLQHYEHLVGSAAVSEDDGLLTFSLTLYAEGQEGYPQALAALECWTHLQRLADLGQLRALAARYDIDPRKLEALLPKETD